MKLSDFDFELPNELIALRPVNPRSSSKLLVSKDDKIIDDQFLNLLKYLKKGDRLVLNDTKVIPAKLHGKRIRHSDNGRTTANIGINLLSTNNDGHWLALAKPAKRVNVGEIINFDNELTAKVLDKSSNGLVLQFNLSEEIFDQKLKEIGTMPLPPYIASQRLPDKLDDNDYQTVFAEKSGSVAAPTASLHFDDVLLKQLNDFGIKTSKVTLHVGAGTFLPVKVDNIADHKMHSEWGEVNNIAASEIAKTKSEGGRIIPVGTTALRLIETAAKSGKINAGKLSNRKQISFFHIFISNMSKCFRGYFDRASGNRYPFSLIFTANSNHLRATLLCKMGQFVAHDEAAFCTGFARI